ncbi:ATP-binding protein [Desulfosporosinus sp. SYSU MS00001]|uniref:ATP-binding protein n=1 Tax=Desulfosporosinus sp. SYSU MS00001 TaxID=3416284 RepID=UPI003CF50C79
MRLREVILKNFRSYKNEVRIPINNLTAFIGRNDIGKSTILEALEIFYNSSIVKIDSQDACVYSGEYKVVIGCIFDDLPDSLVIDTNATTTLAAEYLLNEAGFLEIHKIYDCSNKNPKESIFAIAKHPTAAGVNDLLLTKNSDLKTKIKNMGIDTKDIDLRCNTDIRKAIWKNTADLDEKIISIPLNKEDAKIIWESLNKYLPTFALFQADRPSKDDDAEIQDPMKLAISEAIKSVETELKHIKDVVKERTLLVATRTLDKLREMDPDLANELSPNFKADPKWDSLFKLSLEGDDQIPVNKRGSGVRRLILLNFFRAEVERKQSSSNSPGIIYAIEEPETAQHPRNQKMLVEALRDLSEHDNCQVILTTHVPGLAGLLPLESLRYLDKDSSDQTFVSYGNEELFAKIANDLGVLPDERVKMFLCVEGPHDVRFLRHISSMLNKVDESLPDIASDPRIAILPLGGSTLKDWVQNHYLKGLEKPEVHIYDRDTETPPKYQHACDEVNARGDGSIGFLTMKRELENYLHPDAIQEVYGFPITLTDTDDVPCILAKTVHQIASTGTPWDDLDPEKQKKKEGKVKKRLNDEVASRMTYERLTQIDTINEIEGWLREIARRIS